MMAHTPGPWEVHDAFIANEPNHLIISEAKWGGRNIADCGLSSDETDQANAHLIASAPDMYEALNQALLIKQLLDRGYACQSHGDALRTDAYDDEASECFDKVTEIIHKAQAALSRARGE